MRVNGVPYQTIWLKKDDPTIVELIDQTVLPHEFRIARLNSYRDGITAIKDMWVRGAPLIGATAAWSFYLACIEAHQQNLGLPHIKQASEALVKARPTAVNLQWSIDRMLKLLDQSVEQPNEQLIERARQEAAAIMAEDVAICSSIGDYGLELLDAIRQRKGNEPVHIMTHCNAGWLATVDWGTATAPMYKAKQSGLPIHVWVDETRPRNQGAYLTAWELAMEEIPHDIIVDNAGGHLMQQGQVDMVIVGTDRTASNGDVANKIGTYLKALAAWDNNVPFYVAAPSTSIDWQMARGSDIPIEEREPDEVTHVSGVGASGYQKIRIANNDSPARNPSFDVTPARLVTGIITEKGVCSASREGLQRLFPEKFAA